MKRTLFYLILLFEFMQVVAYGQIVSKDSIQERYDLLYVAKSSAKNDSLQRLNIMLPSGGNDFPLLMWIGGGAWSYVNRDMEMDLGRRFAKEGIAFASVGHRLSSAVWKDSTLSNGIKHPEHVKDIASAFKWLYERASEFGYDQDRIFVGGYSSGGHLTALLSMDSTYLNDVELSLNNVRGIIPIAGAYDISNYYKVFAASETNSAMAETHVKAVFGQDEEDFLKASPTEYVLNLSVPMLLISENDTYNYTKILEDKISAADYQNFQVLHIQSMGHGELWKHLSYDDHSMYRDFIISFIKTNSRAHSDLTD